MVGAAIGTGLLFQSGKALYIGGPVSLWLGYLLMGTVMYAVLVCLCLTVMTLDYSWRDDFLFTHTRRILLACNAVALTGDRSCHCVLSNVQGFACGWSYWFAYAVGFPAKLVACQNIMAFWLPKDQYNSSIWITVFLIIPVLFNNFNVRRYGEIEFWLTVVKVATIVGLIFLGILLPMGASPTRLLGTDPVTLNLVECPSDPSSNIVCVGTPGFGCTSLNLNFAKTLL